MRKANKCLAGLLTAASILAVLPTASSAVAPDHIVINQIYGGGGKGDTSFSHSFIELYNPTNAEIFLENYKITYSSNRDNSKGKHNGSTWQSDGSVEVEELALAGTIPANSSFLIRCEAESTDVAIVTLKNYDMDWNQVIDNDQSVEITLYQGEQRIDAISTRATDFRNVGEGFDILREASLSIRVHE